MIREMNRVAKVEVIESIEISSNVPPSLLTSECGFFLLLLAASSVS